MTTSVVCISRTIAAGGEDVGRRVAELLGFQYADDEIIDRAAERAGVSPEAVADAERTPRLIGRILEALAATPAVPMTGGWAGYPVTGTTLPIPYEDLIQRVIRERAEQGKVVIVAHGGSACLRGVPSVLRVLVTAPAEARTSRLCDERGLKPAEAKKAVAESDRQRQMYLERFYQVQERPTDYDIVLNTEVIGPERSAEIVVLAAKH